MSNKAKELWKRAEEEVLQELEEKDVDGIRLVTDEDVKEWLDIAATTIDKTFNLYKDALVQYNNAKYNRFDAEVVKNYEKAAEQLGKAHCMLIKNMLTTSVDLILLQKKGELYVEL